MSEELLFGFSNTSITSEGVQIGCIVPQDTIDFPNDGPYEDNGHTDTLI
jgi:hypothetical protein